jgi:FkbM family methyltransferase
MSLIRGIKHQIASLFPGTARGYRRFKTVAYLRYFEAFPTLASAIREFREEAHKAHRSSFGMDLVGPRYLIDSGFESDEIALVEKKLEQTDVFVDVGANLGLYTCLAASKGRRVVAIEPLASNLRYLYRNIRSNRLKGVEVFPVGLSSAPGLSVLGGIGAQASFLPNWAQADYSFNQYVETVCPVSTLDIVLGNRFSGMRLLIKIDVEGFEFEVLQGATATLEMSPKPSWIVECFLDKYHPGSRNPNFSQAFAKFFDRGYGARAASENGASVTRETIGEWVKQGAVEGGVYNFLFEPSPSDRSLKSSVTVLPPKPSSA